MEVQGITSNVVRVLRQFFISYCICKGRLMIIDVTVFREKCEAYIDMHRLHVEVSPCHCLCNFYTLLFREKCEAYIGMQR